MKNFETPLSQEIDEQWNQLGKTGTYVEDVLELVARYSNIYNPPNEKIEAAINPYLERIQQNLLQLSEIINAIDSPEDFEDGLANIIKFFSAEFDLKQIPSLQLIRDRRATWSACYQANEQQIKLNLAHCNTLPKTIEDLAHELWHAHQDEIDNEEYRINQKHSIRPYIDYDAYCNQLIEKEAFAIGRNVYDLCEEANLFSSSEQFSEIIESFDAPPEEDGLFSDTIF